MNTKTKAFFAALVFDPFVKMMGIFLVIILVVLNVLAHATNTPVISKSYDCLIDTEVVVGDTLTCEMPVKSE